jgi:sensor histidine kinase YesM
LQFITEIPHELEQVPFPALLLQTLVENAVVHGIEPNERAGTISVSVRREGSRIAVCVTDDGVGIDRAKPPVHGLGLRNTRERLGTFYAGRASLELMPAVPSGTVAAISIPAEP